MFQWVEKMGGVAAMEQRNREKAALLYDLIEQSEIFQNPMAKEDRSIMNVTFTRRPRKTPRHFYRWRRDEV